MGAAGAVSRLYIANANKKDSGNYSCSLADVAAATMVSVHVLNGRFSRRLARESARAIGAFPCALKPHTLHGVVRGQRTKGRTRRMALCPLPINAFGESRASGSGEHVEDGGASRDQARPEAATLDVYRYNFPLLRTLDN